MSGDLIGRKKRPSKADVDKWSPHIGPQYSCKRAALACLPFQYLPLILHPRLNCPLQPPWFHYGYIRTREWISEYGKEHNLLQFSPDPRPSYSHEMVENLFLTVNAIFKFILEETQIKSFTLKHEYVKGLADEDLGQHLMCICSNYDRDNGEQPTLEDIKKMKDYLGFSDPPGWNVDYTVWMWRKD